MADFNIGAAAGGSAVTVGAVGGELYIAGATTHVGQLRLNGGADFKGNGTTEASGSLGLAGFATKDIMVLAQPEAFIGVKDIGIGGKVVGGGGVRLGVTSPSLFTSLPVLPFLTSSLAYTTEGLRYSVGVETFVPTKQPFTLGVSYVNTGGNGAVMGTIGLPFSF